MLCLQTIPSKDFFNAINIKINCFIDGLTTLWSAAGLPFYVASHTTANISALSHFMPPNTITA